MSEILYSEEILYAIVLKNLNGERFYASRDADAGAMFFGRRKEAIAFRNELSERGCGKGSVVKVRVRIDLAGKE